MKDNLQLKVTFNWSPFNGWWLLMKDDFWGCFSDAPTAGWEVYLTYFLWIGFLDTKIDNISKICTCWLTLVLSFCQAQPRQCCVKFFISEYVIGIYFLQYPALVLPNTFLVVISLKKTLKIIKMFREFSSFASCARYVNI